MQRMDACRAALSEDDFVSYIKRFEEIKLTGVYAPLALRLWEAQHTSEEGWRSLNKLEMKHASDKNKSEWIRQAKQNSGIVCQLRAIVMQLASIDGALAEAFGGASSCLLYTSPSPRDRTRSRMPSSA
eukprot:TRINITY_DN21897_c0_g1_i2.p2 TRINITY_DN21897_c0_g1~~TRINITY_DN21897_c0_g1_i2.p2  ORF type:complete len:128 (+),score=49.31 TRINITY_DN21897_c0_g1_i2:115-498(+)